MIPEIKAQWTAALRSGVYKQGQNYLRSGDKFCCLGVLCEIAVQHGVIPAPSHEKAGCECCPDRFSYGANDSRQFLPQEVTEWAGLETDAPGVTYEGTLHSLTSLNDTYKTSFSGIADAIDASL